MMVKGLTHKAISHLMYLCSFLAQLLLEYDRFVPFWQDCPKCLLILSLHSLQPSIVSQCNEKGNSLKGFSSF